MNGINSFRPTDQPKAKVNFLDVVVTIQNDVLKTDFFVEPTDTY